MEPRDEVAAANQQLWEREVAKGCGFTIPWLDLDVDAIHHYVEGTDTPADSRLGWLTPRSLLRDVRNKHVLCLAHGGGQQSAVFGLLGAHVTVVDLAQGQLDGDEKAAAHYGYPVTTIHADMRDLSELAPESFDLVYGTTICYVPDAREVYRQVARVLRRGGLYRCNWRQPVLQFVEWDGQTYRITQPYEQPIDRRADGGIEFRHYMDDIFGGLLETGFTIEQVDDLSRHARLSDTPPGSWAHHDAYVGGEFVVVARKR